MLSCFTKRWAAFTRTVEYILLNFEASVYSLFDVIGDATFYSIFGEFSTRLFCGYTCYIKSIVSSVRRVWWQISAPLLPLYIFTKSLIFIANSVVHSLLTSKTDEKSRILSFVTFHHPSQQSFLYLLNLALMSIVPVRSIKKHIILLPDTSVDWLTSG